MVEHLDDLQYFFSSTNIPKIAGADGVEGQIVYKFTKLLHSFAKNGYAFSWIWSYLWFICDHLRMFFHRYPYFGPDILASKAKFNEDETYVKFDTTYELDERPFKNAFLWDSLFPMNN